jgi:L-rhamnose isomerase
MRNMQKELLKALLQPSASLKEMQDKGDFTSQLVWQEELKNYPVGDVWEEFCRRAKTPAGEEWLEAVKDYEREVLAGR